MFYGVSPGAGKTTLSDWLRLELTNQGANVVWIEEQHVNDLEMFAEVIKVFTKGADDYKTPLLKAAEMLVQEYQHKDQIVLTDSLFPSYTWLFASGVPRMVISEINQKLADILKLLNPLIIWLNGDVSTLLQRAIKQRGEDWLKDLIESINSYTYAPVRPIVDIVEVESFFKELKVLHLDMLTEWPHDVLKLDVTETPLEILQTNIKGQLEKSRMS
jgi:thymidylate kinase